MLKQYWESKAAQELEVKACQLKQVKNEKLLDVMIDMARQGDLSLKRFNCFMTALADRKIGEDDVQRYLLALSEERKNRNK